MKAGNSSKLVCALAVATAVLIPVSGWSQAPFPEGQARDAVFLACVQCHPLTRITDGSLNAEEWEFTLYDMISRGAPIHEEDLALVRQYLIDNFAIDE